MLTCLYDVIRLCLAWIYLFISMIYGQIIAFTYLYAWIHVLPCLCTNFLHVYMYVSMPICLDLCSHMSVLGSMFSTCFMLYFMCLCTPCHVCVPRPRLYLSCHVLLQPFCCFIFLSCVLAQWLGPDLDLMVFVIVHTPWPKSKGLDNPCLHVYACSLLCFMFLLASLVQGFATLDALNEFVVLRLHSTPMRPYLDVTIWDASP